MKKELIDSNGNVVKIKTGDVSFKTMYETENSLHGETSPVDTNISKKMILSILLYKKI